ncbi:MAG TPA: hypothetical protein VKT80_11735 [Chloroflexota bacterium]|nr:hypothetical protein [Chloroflexota bacterium]
MRKPRPGNPLGKLGLARLLPTLAATQVGCGGQQPQPTGSDDDGLGIGAVRPNDDDNEDDSDDNDDDERGRAATYSSSIALSSDGRLVWSVNSAVDTVSVIRTDKNQVIADSGKEVQAGIGDQASMGVERGSAAGSAGPEAIPQPTGRVARIFFRHLNKLSEEALCAVGSEWASRLRI